MRSHLIAIGVATALLAVVSILIFTVGPTIVRSHDGSVNLSFNDGDSGKFSLRKDDYRIEADWKGAFALAADGKWLESLDGVLEVSETKDGERRTAKFEGEGDDVVATLKVGADIQPDTPETQAAISELLLRYVRESGVKAEARVAAIVAERGIDAVFGEIDAIETTQARASYLEALSQQAELDASSLEKYVEAAAKMESDFARRIAAASLAEHQSGEAGARASVRIARKISSDFELRQVVEALAERRANVDAAIDLFEDIESDFESRLAAEAIFGSDAADDDLAALILAKTARGGDYESRLAIDAALDRAGEARGALARATIAKSSGIDSDHERRLAIETIADDLASDDTEAWLLLIGAADPIKSDYEKRLALAEIAEAAPTDGQIREAIRRAAAAISSDHERRLALESVDD